MTRLPRLSLTLAASLALAAPAGAQAQGFSFAGTSSTEDAADAYSRFCLSVEADPADTIATAERQDIASWTAIPRDQAQELVGVTLDRAWIVLPPASTPFILYFSHDGCGVQLPSFTGTDIDRQFDRVAARFIVSKGETYWPKPLETDPQDTRLRSKTLSFVADHQSHSLSISVFTDTDMSELALLTYAVN